VFGNEPRHGVDRSQPLVARADRAIALFFQKIKEARQDIVGQIAYQEPIYSLLAPSASKRQKECQSIPVALLRVTR
jgi:hypothetical protein